MANKRTLATVTILAILLLLILHEANSWRHFNWSVFWDNARGASLAHALAAIAMTYSGYVLRAARWRVFLRPLRTVGITRLLGPTIVGFTGLALLGRPGEFIRPYMIARKEGLSLSSQIATLAVERLFDTASAGVLIMVALVFSPELHSLPHMAQFRRGIVILAMLVTTFALFLFLLARHGQSLSRALQRVLSPVSKQIAQRASQHFRVFSSELNMIRDAEVSGANHYSLARDLVPKWPIVPGNHPRFRWGAEHNPWRGYATVGIRIFGIACTAAGRWKPTIDHYCRVRKGVRLKCGAGRKLQHLGLVDNFYGAGADGTRLVAIRGFHAAKLVSRKSPGRGRD